MPTKITRIDQTEEGNIVLRVEGSLEREDAVLIEKIAMDAQSESAASVAIDLADLNFLDSEGASVLKNLTDKGFIITGLEIFLQKTVNEVESKNNPQT